MRAAESQPRPPTHPAQPDWLEDVRQAESAAVASGVVLVREPKPPPVPPPVRQPRPPSPAKASAPTPEQAPPPVTAPVPTTAPPGQGLLDIGSATSPGMVRERNEDSFLVLRASWANLDQRHEMAIVVVADGMGGQLAGEKASGLVIGALGKALAPLLAEAIPGPFTAQTAALPRAIDRAFEQANRTVTEAAKGDAGCQGMGATAVALVIRDDEAHIGLVGDCRVYHQRGNQLTQVTRDQTLVARMVELGQLTPEEAVNHPRRNEITQAVGQPKGAKPAPYEVKLERGDWLVAACDGLNAHVEDELLQETISQGAASAGALARRLVELTNQRGGSDNCTVVAVHWS